MVHVVGSTVVDSLVILAEPSFQMEKNGDVNVDCRVMPGAMDDSVEPVPKKVGVSAKVTGAV